ncbi:MAG: allantoate amidohydrolase [Planctomycetota bacterium]
MIAEAAVRVMARCEEISLCTEEPGRVTRRFLAEPMHRVHGLLGGWMEEAGLSTRVDDAGNLVGRLTASPEARSLLVGSHLDSVPNGGRYDGVLGVLIALAAAEQCGAETLPFHLDIIGFSEEEGVRYSMPYLGSNAVAGRFDVNWFDRVDAQGVTLHQAITSFGLNPSGIASAAYDPERVIGYLEPHLEQGPVLDRAGLPVGVVDGIAGQSRIRIEFRGESGHAGTTPMEGRRDALVSAARFVEVVRQAGRNFDDLRATVGRIECAPNAPNVIPGAVRLSLDLRHKRDEPREAALEQILEAASGIAEEESTPLAILEELHQPAVAVGDELTELLADAVEECGLQRLSVSSGAGHDAVAMSAAFPVAMLFVRHPGAVSHHPDERVDEADVAVAIDVMTRFFRRLAEAERRSVQDPSSL